MQRAGGHAVPECDTLQTELVRFKPLQHWCIHCHLTSLNIFMPLCLLFWDTGILSASVAHNKKRAGADWYWTNNSRVK